MGTNYYAHGRGRKTLHIGKSSAGWCFGLHVIPDRGLTDWPEWEEYLSRRGVGIRNEYGEAVTLDDMRRCVTGRMGRRDKAPPTAEWLRQNHADVGPYNLARHRIDGRHCVGHGAGTWDLIAGCFS